MFQTKDYSAWRTSDGTRVAPSKDHEGLFIIDQPNGIKFHTVRSDISLMKEKYPPFNSHKRK